MIRPILEYISSVWDPHNKKSNSKIDMVQHRAVHFTLNWHYNTSSVEAMLEILEWQTLQQCQHAARLPMPYKITNDLAHVKSHDLTLQPCSGQRGHNLKCMQI